MRIIKLDEESRKGVLDRLLKRSPDHYGQYEDTVDCGAGADRRGRGAV